ncbi:MAG: chemotaxis protein CheW [Spirochaetae bacterium HGW-Spirochaetae-7]|jgi:purine-binding chemotaxis protein CheW|nr:MAG: chemotaxis protein CheW [Spirochaetae bacterium HGW-Spirochaetae-7]
MIDMDWNAVRQRLEAAGAASVHGETRPEEERKSILHERSRILAKRIDLEVAAEETIEAMEFELYTGVYALNCAFVREACTLRNLTPLPCAPPFVLGIANVRGRIVPIVDLGNLLDLPASGLGKMSSIIILQGKLVEFGILVDAILGVTRISGNEIRPLLSTMTGIGRKRMLGILPKGIVLLDAESIVNDKSLVINETVAWDFARMHDGE